MSVARSDRALGDLGLLRAVWRLRFVIGPEAAEKQNFQSLAGRAETM